MITAKPAAETKPAEESMPSPDAEAVRALLASQSAPVESRSIALPNAVTQTEPPKLDPPVEDPLLNKKTEQEDLAAWTLASSVVGKVTLTDEEQESVLRELLTGDGCVQLTITLPGAKALQFTFRDISEYELKQINWYLTDEINAKRILRNEDYASLYQGLLVTLCLLGQDGRDVQAIAPLEPSLDPEVRRQQRRELEQAMLTKTMKTSSALFAARRTGLRIFYAKMAIAQARLRDETFSKPPSTGS